MLAALALILTPPPDAARVAELTADIGRLNHPRFAIREQAMMRLSEGELGSVPMLRAATRSHDPETSERAGVALSAIIEREAVKLEPVPEIDSAYFIRLWERSRSYPENVPDHIRRACDAALVLKTGRCRVWEDYYHATELWVRDRLAVGWSPRFLRIVLANWHRLDAVHIGRIGPYASLVVDPEAYLKGFKK
jgi:hypothetical protein